MNTIRLTAVLSCLALVGAANAQTLVRSVHTGAGAQFGKACVVVSDQNGDGFKDVLGGAPEFNSGRGAIYCISGAFLATGALPNTLWQITAPPVNAGAAFGTSIIEVPSLTGNSAPDFVVGAPDYVPTGAFDTRGAIFLIDGSTHAVVTFIHGLPQTHFGQTMAAVGDQTGDGKTDIAVGAPDVSPTAWNLIHVVPGAAFGLSTSLATIAHPSKSAGWPEYGAALASGFDYDGDGKLDLVASVPGYGFTFPSAGYIEILRATDLSVITFITRNVAGERFGSSIDVTQDFDNDGVNELVVGAPGAPNGSAFEVGRAVVVSGANLIAGTPPFELYSFPFGSVTPPVNHSDPDPDFHFGAAVSACADLNGDGVGEILVGAPDFFTQSFSGAWNFRGLVRVYSGATGTQLAGIAGGSTDKLGSAIAGAVDDLDGDGFSEFVVAGALSDAGGIDSGVVSCYRLFPLLPLIYCVGKVNSLGCTPSIVTNGSVSASSGSPFLVIAINVINQKSGLLFYGHAPASQAFQGGTKCVANPITRSAPMNSGGSASGADCTGTYSLDFNARIASGIDPTLVAGAELYAQYWSRDPASASQTSLSNAVQFVVNP